MDAICDIALVLRRIRARIIRETGAIFELNVNVPLKARAPEHTFELLIWILLTNFVRSRPDCTADIAVSAEDEPGWIRLVLTIATPDSYGLRGWRNHTFRSTARAAPYEALERHLVESLLEHCHGYSDVKDQGNVRRCLVWIPRWSRALPQCVGKGDDDGFIQD
jgi:hypothetical protein